MSTVFLSYRRRDAEGTTGRIHDWLERHYGPDEVFRDTEDIPLGVDFRQRIQGFIEQAGVVLAIIGPGWNAVGESGRRRLSSSRDWVRIEIATALGGGVPVVPVCVDGGEIPAERHLPKALREFAYKQAAFVDSGRDFAAHMQRLIRDIDLIVEQRNRLLALKPTEPQTPPDAVPPQVWPASPDNSVSSVAELLARQLSDIGKEQNGTGTTASQLLQAAPTSDPAVTISQKRPNKQVDGSGDWSILKKMAKTLARKEI